MPKKVLQDREYAKINGRLYTRHAVDRMTPKNFGRAAGGSKGRGIPTLIVEDVIENGVITKTEIAKNGAKRITKSLNDVHVVLEGNIVITTIDTGSKGL